MFTKEQGANLVSLYFVIVHLNIPSVRKEEEQGFDNIREGYSKMGLTLDNTLAERVSHLHYDAFH